MRGENIGVGARRANGSRARGEACGEAERVSIGAAVLRKCNRGSRRAGIENCSVACLSQRERITAAATLDPSSGAERPEPSTRCVEAVVHMTEREIEPRAVEVHVVGAD